MAGPVIEFCVCPLRPWKLRRAFVYLRPGDRLKRDRSLSVRPGTVRCTLNRDSPPRPSSLGTGAHTQTTNHPRRDQLEVRHPPRSYRGTRPRFASGTLMSLRRPPKPPRTHQVAYRRAHREPLGAATFSGSALRVSHGRSPQPHTQNTQPPSNTLNRDSPPPHQFARHGAHTKPPRIYRNPGGTAAHPEY